MYNIKQYIIDYVEGRIDSKNFIKEINENSEIVQWLQSIVPSTKIGYYDVITRPDGSWYQKTGPYNVKIYLDSIFQETNRSQLGRELNLFSEISRLILEAFPDENIKVSTVIQDKYKFILDACPEYLFSNEIENSGIFESLMEQFPESLSKSKRVKAFRQELKTMFYVEGQKYPRWIQGSEWPLSKTGKPTKFIRQKSKGEVHFYYFLDMDSGKEIEVVQTY